MPSAADSRGTPGHPTPPRVVPVRPVVLSIRIAASGLVLVLLVLTVFSVSVSVSNARGAERAERSAVESDKSERALEALTTQEESAEEVVAAVGHDETRGEYDAAHVATRRALQDLEQSGEPTRAVRELQALHEGYGEAVEQMFVVAGRSPDAAEQFEDSHVDPYFDPLVEALDGRVHAHYQAARAALTSIGRSQQLLLVATPVLFGTGFVLLTTFSVMLSRSRRLVLAQVEENRYQSLHDALTGLPNRTLLRQRSEAALAQALATGTPMGLLLIDLDRFKQINDTLGHHHGDLVLQALAERLCLAVRSTDTVARLGGDEFAILLPQVSDIAGALGVAVAVQAALEHSIDAGGVSLDVDISMGVVLSGAHGNDVATLLQHADIAMYRAKDRDLGVCVYDDGLNEHSREQLGLLGELRRAIDDDELLLHFQPKVTLPGGRFCGAEALLRWDHPTRGLVGPGSFLPAAEHTALIRPLTQWVLNAALAECQRWRDRGTDLRLAVNVSARNLLDADFADDVLALLDHWGLSASCLQLEVTESAIMVEPKRAEAVLLRLAEMGIELAIDDFGAGYTSMAHLRTLPVQELKIDQSLVAQMSISASDALIVRAVIDLGHSLGLRTVAEGVEDEETLQRLSAMGCDVAQGFHIARPMASADLVAWTADRATPLLVQR